jgi:hypothetical protein
MLLRERRSIQARRKVSAWEFARWLTPELSSPYLGPIIEVRALQLALRAYWALVMAVLRLAR